MAMPESKEFGPLVAPVATEAYWEQYRGGQQSPHSLRLMAILDGKVLPNPNRHMSNSDAGIQIATKEDRQ